MAANINQKTLDHCRKLGWVVAKTEHWNHFAHKRFDLFGCIDFLALDGHPGVIGLQATTNAHAAARLTKCIETIPIQWLEAGNRLEVWDWGKRGDRGKRKLWTVERRPILLADLNT